jgi:flavin-dependent dehydrogenase
VLNGLLLDRAKSAGCTIVRSRVNQVDAAGERAVITIGKSCVETDFVVIAAGARNALLPNTQPLSRNEMEMTAGYFVPAQAETIRVKFLRRFEGYLWSFPRLDHLSVGICGSMARHTSKELRKHLHEFMTEEHLSSEGAQFYSHVLPSPQKHTLSARRVVGRNWALIGDAAAWVDPITGEGIYYALRSGDLLAEMLIAGKPEEYPAKIRKAFSFDLEFATRIARRLYRGRFLGDSVSTRMIQFIEWSPTFRSLMADVFTGSQDYRSLKKRLFSQCGKTLMEVAGSLLKTKPALAKSTPTASTENLN